MGSKRSSSILRRSSHSLDQRTAADELGHWYGRMGRRGHVGVCYRCTCVIVGRVSSGRSAGDFDFDLGRSADASSSADRRRFFLGRYAGSRPSAGRQRLIVG